MKNSISLIKILITTNFIIAGCSVLFFVVSRSWENRTIAEAQLEEKEEQSYHREVKAQVSDEQRQLQQQQEKLYEQEQTIENLSHQLAQYQQSDFSKLNQPFAISELPTQKSPLDDPLSLQMATVTPSVSSSLEVSSSPILSRNYRPTQPQKSRKVKMSWVSEQPKKAKTNPSTLSSTSSQSATVTESVSQTQEKAITEGINYANDISAGLLVAQNFGQIRHGTKQYNRYQSAIRLLRQGKSLEDVAQEANIPLTDLHQVIAWGENRPGNTNKHQPPILSPQTRLARLVDEPIRYANDIAAGLLVADRKGHINHGTIQYKRVQTAIKLLRQGNTLQQAAYRSNVSMATLEQLIRWGEVRPGSQAIDWHQQITRRFENWQSE